MFKKMMKRLGRLLVVLLLLFLALVWGYAGYERYISLSDTSLQKKRSSVHDRVVSKIIDLDERSLHYIDIGDVGKPVMILIHGAPGSISDRSGVMKQTALYDTYRVIAVDRLGYGRSGMGHPETSIQLQSDSIFALLDVLDIDQAAVVGHSYGGPIVADMLMRGPDGLVGGLIFAGAVDPEYEIVFPISRYVDVAPMKYVMGPMLWSANREKLTHIAELEKFDARDSIQKPLRVVHGTADSLVPYENVAYIQQQVSQEYLSVRSLEGIDHPIQFNQPEIIVQEMLAFETYFGK